MWKIRTHLAFGRAHVNQEAAEIGLDVRLGSALACGGCDRQTGSDPNPAWGRCPYLSIPLQSLDPSSHVTPANQNQPRLVRYRLRERQPLPAGIGSALGRRAGCWKERLEAWKPPAPSETYRPRRARGGHTEPSRRSAQHVGAWCRGGPAPLMPCGSAPVSAASRTYPSAATARGPRRGSVRPRPTLPLRPPDPLHGSPRQGRARGVSGVALLCAARHRHAAGFAALHPLPSPVTGC